jgi:hypothetical protein
VGEFKANRHQAGPGAAYGVRIMFIFHGDVWSLCCHETSTVK